jgi:NAD(P)-dependent dehydrogenase (short-subunit alcohol dehydrogenase family)
MNVLQAFDLRAKAAVVTGGNVGLGAAFAQALAGSGARVAIAARSQEQSAAVARAIGAAGREAITIEVDVKEPAQVERMVAEVTERLGSTDIFVNNAGICYHRPALEVPREEWHDVFDVNVHGLCSALAPGYVKSTMAPVDRPAFRRYWSEDTPMQGDATPEELGPPLVYLASGASRFLSGAVLVIDGADTLW